MPNYLFNTEFQIWKIWLLILTYANLGYRILNRFQTVGIYFTQLLQSMISCQVGLNSTSKRPQKWLKMTFAFLSISFQGINIFQFFKKWVKLDERALLTRYHLWILIFCMTSIIWSKISDFYQNFQFFSDNFDSLIVLSLVFCYYMGLILLYMR